MTPNEAASAGGGGGGHWRGVMTDGYSDYSGRQNNGIQLNIDIINTIVNLQILAVRIAIVTKKL